MKMMYFGDAYDVVKRFMLEVLDPCAEWVGIPMFTEPVSAGDILRLESFLRLRVIARGTVPLGGARGEYFDLPVDAKRVLLDPNTGIRIKPFGGARAAGFVFAQELVEMCLADPGRLLVVFDQSHDRQLGLRSLTDKMAHLRREGLVGFSYRSQACFVVLSADEAVSAAARERLVASGLPEESRIVDA